VGTYTHNQIDLASPRPAPESRPLFAQWPPDSADVGKTFEPVLYAPALPCPRMA